MAVSLEFSSVMCCSLIEALYVGYHLHDGPVLLRVAYPRPDQELVGRRYRRPQLHHLGR